MTIHSEHPAHGTTICEQTLESALAERGWQPQGPSRWRLATRHGDALLTEAVGRDSWRQYRLVGGALPASANGRVLYDNYHLFGPAKLVAKANRAPVCRLDVPEDLAGPTGGLLRVGGDWGVVDPHAAWADAVSACAAGCFEQEGESSALEEAVADELNRAGWATTSDDGRLHVHLQLPGVYRQLAVERQPSAGVKLATDLVRWGELGGQCVQAMLMLATEANARLPLVRMAVANEPHGCALRAEVGFGHALIAGKLLVAALHVLETAVAMTARELEALRDPELARLVLAAVAARETHEDR